MKIIYSFLYRMHILGILTILDQIGKFDHTICNEFGLCTNYEANLEHVFPLILCSF